MKIGQTRFGALDIPDELVWTCPSGILGFSDWTRYVLLDHDTEAPFKWLQCVEEGSLAFVIMDPTLFKSDYRAEVAEEALAEIKARDADDLALMTILTIPSDDPAAITANLRGPLLMNWRTKLCKQLVLDETFPTRYPILCADSRPPRRMVEVGVASL
jgi:flagellar assembly factor FliW